MAYSGEFSSDGKRFAYSPTGGGFSFNYTNFVAWRRYRGGLASSTNFTRYYFAQTDKDGAVIDERFNSGRQAADRIIQVMGRELLSYWAPRYCAIYRTPSASILGPKVMMVNEFPVLAAMLCPGISGTRNWDRWLASGPGAV